MSDTIRIKLTPAELYVKRADLESGAARPVIDEFLKQNPAAIIYIVEEGKDE